MCPNTVSTSDHEQNRRSSSQITPSARRSLEFRLYISTAVSLLGGSISSLGIPLALLAATGSITLAGTLALAQQIPQLVLALPLSAVSDALPRKPLMVLGCFLQACTMIVLTILLATGTISIPTVIVLGAIQGITLELANASAAGYIPVALGRDSLLRFNTRQEVIEGVMALAGPSIGGSIVQFLGALWGTAASCLTSLMNAILYLSMTHLPGEKTHFSPKDLPNLREVWRGAYQGMMYMLSKTQQRIIVFSTLFLATATASYGVILVYRLNSELGFSPVQTGFILGSSGLGGLMAAFLVDRYTSLRHLPQILLLAHIVAILALALVSWVSSPYVLAVLFGVLDMAWVTGFIFIGTLRDYITPDALLARAYAADGTIHSLGTFLTMLWATLLLETCGTGFVLALINIFGLLSLGYLIFQRTSLNNLTPAS